MLLGLLIRKEQKSKIVLERFETNDFICALRKDRSALLTAYPLSKTEEQKMIRSMDALNL
jgi:hypothetical protein